MVIEVTQLSNVPGPPDDLVSIIHPLGWEHFTTGQADAWIILHVADDDSFLLHYIESHGHHHADALLYAIGEWADEEGLTGSLVCNPSLLPMYERHGWKLDGPWAGGMIVMKRRVTPG